MASRVAELAVTVNGKQYTIGCADGEEPHVARLAADLDRRVAALVRSIGAVGEARLLLMAALLVADELHELRHGGGASAAMSAPALLPTAVVGADEGVAARIDALAARIEAVAGQLEAL